MQQPYQLPSRDMREPTPHSSDAITRRDALRRAALLLGGVVSAPTVAAVLAGCEAPPAGQATRTTRGLAPEQAALVATIAEHIIPRTETPGARDAGVDRFIARMLAEYYGDDERARFLDGLADVDRRARDAKGRPFLQLNAGEQHDLLAALDAEAFEAHASPAPFFRRMKELTLVGYYTSLDGATRELAYAGVPGRFDGCIPLATVGRAWAT